MLISWKHKDNMDDELEMFPDLFVSFLGLHDQCRGDF